MLSATFDDRGGGANDPAFSVDLTRSRAIFRDPEILYIIRGTCCTSQGDPDSSFPCGPSTDITVPNVNITAPRTDVATSFANIIESNRECSRVS